MSFDIYQNEEDLVFQNNSHSYRWRKRRIKKAFEKKILQLYKEECKLWETIRNMEYEELEEPIQRGFKRHFELTEGIKKNKRASFFQGILNKINTVQHSPDKQFKKIRKKKVGRRKYRKVGMLKLRDLDERAFRILSEEERLYFYPVDYYNHRVRKWLKIYRFAEPWLFEVRVRPNMLTKVQKHNWEAEKREKEISDYLEKYRLYNKIEKIKHRYRWDYEWREPMYKMKNENPLKNVPLHRLEEEYKHEKELWAYDQKN